MRTWKRVPVFAGLHNVEIYDNVSYQGCLDFISFSLRWANREYCRILGFQTPTIFSYYTYLLFSGGCYHGLPWGVVKSEMVMGAFFAFLGTACDGMTKVVKVVETSRLMTQKDGVLVLLSHEVRETIKKIGHVLVICQSN